MAEIAEKVLDFVGWETNVDGEEDIYEDDIIENTPHHRFERGVSHRKNPQGKVLNMNNNNNLKVVVLSPQNILEARELCDHLKSNKPVIMNVEGVDTPLAQRMVDFLSGAVCALTEIFRKYQAEYFLQRRP